MLWPDQGLVALTVRANGLNFASILRHATTTKKLSELSELNRVKSSQVALNRGGGDDWEVQG